MPERRAASAAGRALGMDCRIARRDILHGAALLGAAAVAGDAKAQEGRGSESAIFGSHGRAKNAGL
jgi:hypothetical protein